MDIAIAPSVKEFILHHQVARLATADRCGRPHVIPFCYAFSGDRFYFVVDEKPKKITGKPLKRIQNILENRHVALVIDDYSSDWTRLAYVLVRGSAALVEDESEYARVLVELRTRYPQYRKMSLTYSASPMIRITPTRINAWGRGLS